MPFDPTKPFDLVPDATPDFDPARPFELVDQNYEDQLATGEKAFSPDDPRVVKQADLAAQLKAERHRGDYWEGVANRADALASTVVEPLSRPVSGAIGRALDVPLDATLNRDQPELQHSAERLLRAPGIDLPRAGEAPTPGGKVAAALYNASADLLAMASSPDAAAVLPAGVNKLVLTTWLAQMVGQQPERVMTAAQLVREGKPQQAMQEIALGVGELGLAELGRRHLMPSDGITAADVEGAPRLNVNGRGEVVDAPEVRADEGPAALRREVPEFDPSKPFTFVDPVRQAVQRRGLAPERPVEVLTPEVKAATVLEPPAAETITGSNEGTASEMPAEREERPTSGASAVSSAQDRPPDIIDELLGSVGKLDPALIREADPNWKPVGAARKLFRKGGIAADSGLDAVTRGGPKFGVEQGTSIDEFGAAINAAARARMNERKGNAAANRGLDLEARQLEQFQKRALAGERPKAQAANVETVPAEGLIEGDTFQVQQHKFTVEKLEVDQDGRLLSVTVKDGPKFGVQTFDPGHWESLHIDKGTFQPVPREEWPVFEGAAGGKAGERESGREGGNVQRPTSNVQRSEDFALGAPESIEEQRVRLEQEAAARAQVEARAAAAERAAAPLTGGTGDLGQGDLLGGGEDLFAPPSPGGVLGDPSVGGAAATALPKLGAPIPAPAAATPPPGAPGTAVLFDARLPVTLDRTARGSVAIPDVMRSMEAIIRATGAETPIRTGRFHQRARGIYDPRQEVTRLASADNIPTATHETGHALQKQLYGSAYAAGLRGLPPAIKAELVKLGRALYGSTRPAAGYSGEGFAEFTRLYLSTDDAARLAPATERFFRERVLVDHPEVARAVAATRQLIDTYRAQGSVERARRQLVKRPGVVARVVQNVKDFLGAKAQLDEFEPLWQLSSGYERRTGSKLAPASDPFLLASWKRGTAGSVVERMVNDGMLDPWGNPVLAPGGGSLRQALGPVKGRGEDFALYLFGRRALERHAKGLNPGITMEDAQQLVTQFDSPEFQLAARSYYNWQNGLLDYLREANPALAGSIDAIQASSKDYAPLSRVIDPKDATAAAAAARANPLYRMHGSGRQVRDIFETTIENASRLVSMAHRSMVLDSLVKLSKKEGMGFLVEEVPRDRAQTKVPFEKVREQLEAMGVDTSAVDPDAVLSFWGLAEQPKGADPIISVKEADGLHWYHVSPGVFEMLNGLQPARLGPALDLLLGAPSRAFRMGTTGLRASFALFTNPVRDLRTLLMQTQSSANPARMASAYLGSLGEVVRAGLGGKESPAVSAFYRLGAQLGQPLGLDVGHTKRAAKELFHGKMMRMVRTPVEHLRELLQLTEAAPRVAELKLIAREVGWTPGTPMSPDQAVQLALAAKRATVDFSAAGEVAKVINQAVPFYNATIQGTRSFARALRDNPARSVLWGLATFTVPALLNWWKNKDKDWYRELPWRERYLYDNIEDGKGNVWQIPRPPEWGNVFSVIPEALMDSWYRHDPRGVGEALKHIIATQNPLDFPVPLRVAKEQWQNRIEFFDRPIIPRAQVDLPPGEQRGPYTTRLAQWIGDAFPNQASPRRIDAAVRGFLGGAIPDLQQALETAGVKTGVLPPSNQVEREHELSDLPVIGRMFRRGGEFNAQTQAMGDYYDDLTKFSARKEAQDAAVREGRPPLNALTPQEYAYAWTLEETRAYFKAASQLADRTPNNAARQALFRSMAGEARRVLAMRPK